MNKYNILSLLIGVILKLYDDIYDNNLYDSLGILKKNIPYINEFLKSLFIIGFSLISVKYPYFYIFFFIINLLGYIFLRKDYGYFETCGLFASLILIPFINWNNNENNSKNIYFILHILLFIYIFEILMKFKDIEVSNLKLIYRIVCLSILLILILLDSKINILTESMRIIVFFGLGYAITSSIFQKLLLTKN